jgi:hypothetical protein
VITRIAKGLMMTVVALLLVLPLIIIGLVAKLLNGKTQTLATNHAAVRTGTCPAPVRWQRATFTQLKGNKHQCQTNQTLIVSNN